MLKADVEMEKTGVVVFSESNLPGWIAEVDGERAPIYTANYLFMGVLVPEGAHTLTFRYAGSFVLLLERLLLRQP
jgi:uncharacterized membrane protein YfhO